MVSSVEEVPASKPSRREASNCRRKRRCSAKTAASRLVWVTEAAGDSGEDTGKPPEPGRVKVTGVETQLVSRPLLRPPWPDDGVKPAARRRV